MNEAEQEIRAAGNALAEVLGQLGGCRLADGDPAEGDWCLLHDAPMNGGLCTWAWDAVRALRRWYEVVK